MASSSSMTTAASHRRARRRRSKNDRWLTAFVFSSALQLDHSNYPISGVQCLLIPNQRITQRVPFANRGLQSLHLPFIRTSSPSITHQSSVTTTTSLYLFFDKFLHPYGVSNHTNANGNIHRSDEEDESSKIELLNALLPRLQSKEQRIEGFQRARLDEQLRLMKLRGENSIDKGGDGGKEFLADDEEEVSKMTDLFQQARLAEQLRLSRLSPGGGGNEEQENAVLQMGNTFSDKQDDDESIITGSASNIDKVEAFQRALLEERLKIRQLHQQRQRFVSSSDSLERAMMEYVNEREEHKQSQQQQQQTTMTMVQENEEDVIAEDDVVSKEASSDEVRSGDTLVHLGNEDNGNDLNAGNGKVMPLNQTDEDTPLLELREKVEHLHQMVDIATSPPSKSLALSKTTAATTNTTTKSSSLQNFMSNTYLPLPPREDASLLSITLAPIVHFLTSAFLLGAAVFYAILALLDNIWNDTEGKYSTRACLKEASSVIPKCLDYVFPFDDVKLVRKTGAMQRTMRAIQSSCMTSFYAIKCILFRAALYSKFATESKDFGMGALKYLVYTIRSISVLWKRVVHSLAGSFQERRLRKKNEKEEEVAMLASLEEQQQRRKHNKMQSLRQKLNPLRVLSTISNGKKEKRERSLRAEQQRLKSEQLYNDKMHRLNLDRVALERDRQELQEVRRQLETERRQLLSEGVNVLAWYSAAMDAKAVEDVEDDGKMHDENHQKNEQEKKKHWSFWRQKDNQQGF